eukprot:16437960-Heterocapsa_arctica.AAC.1
MSGILRAGRRAAEEFRGGGDPRKRGAGRRCFSPGSAAWSGACLYHMSSSSSESQTGISTPSAAWVA